MTSQAFTDADGARAPSRPDRPSGPWLLSRRSLLGLAAAAGIAGVTGMTACTSRDLDPVDPLPEDRIAFGVSAAPGFTPPIYWAVQSPSLLMYGSGLVLRADDPDSLHGVPSAYTAARLDPRQVARFVAEAERDRVLTGDFGQLQVTDLGSTRVWLHGATGELEASVYGLSDNFDEYVSWMPRHRRRRLRGLIEEGRALVGDGGAPFVPERVVVLEQDAATRGDAAEKPWPGPDPATFLHRPGPRGRGAIGCGELTGQGAAEVYAAARSNPGQGWLVGGRTRVLAVNPLPVEIEC